MGPTASGKTQLAVDLVQRFPLEIISVDSALVYRGMDVGTAKPTPEILAIAPHHLIDIRDPTEPYSAAQFRSDALQAIDQITAKQKIPLLVGGTMLYFRALQYGLSELPTANSDVRKKISLEAKEKGWPALHARLAEVDPTAAQKIHPHDAQRIQRALEIFELSGKNRTELQSLPKQSEPNFEFINIAIAPQDRAVLHERIALRMQNMLSAGFIDEVRKLHNRGDLTISLPSIRSVGYQQVWKYLDGEFTYLEMQEKAIIATRQFAKRQLTWLRHWPDVNWFDSESPALLHDVMALIASKIG